MALTAGGIAALPCILLSQGELQLQGVVLALSLAWASAVDIDRLILPDIITLGLLAIGLVIAAFSGGAVLLDRSIGAVCGYASLSLVALAYKRARKRTGLGQGDAKLFAAAGAWMGWAALPGAMVIAACAALAGLGIRVLLRRPMASDRPVAFGPFLSLGIWLGWLTDVGGFFLFSGA